MRTPPNSVVPHQGVEDGEQLPHTRYQGHLLGLARRQLALVELADDGVAAGDDQRPHVLSSPHRRPPAPHLPLAASVPGVAVEGGDPRRDAQALVGELAQFGQLGQESASEDPAHPGHTPQERLVLREGGARGDGLLEGAIGSPNLFLESPHVRLDAPLERGRGHLEAIPIGREHGEQLASSGKDVLQMLGLLVGDGAWGGADGFRETGEDEGVYPVGLGEAADGLGRVPRLTGIDDRNRDPGGGDGRSGQSLVSSGGLQCNQLDARSSDTSEKFVDALLVVGDRGGFVALHNADFEVSLGNVDAGVDLSSLGGTHREISPFCLRRRPGLADAGLLRTAGAAAPATVRAPPKSGRDDVCFLAVLAEP
jgi:hypothetical protein